MGTVPFRQRLQAIADAERERTAERERLLAEWPTLEAREKGEALRRLFSTVTLFWDKKFHPPVKLPPCRTRKTDRAGRYSYTLRRDRIKWGFAACDLGSSW